MGLFLGLAGACSAGLLAFAAPASAHRTEFGINAAPFPAASDPPVMARTGIRTARFIMGWYYTQPAPPGSSTQAGPQPSPSHNSLLPQCSNFRDDDGDHLVDGADPGCSSPFDNSESNVFPPPPPPTSGKYNWTYWDLEIQRLAHSRIRSLPVLMGVPEWLSPMPNTPPTTTARGRKAWKEFVTAAVKRYGPHGVFWKENPKLPYLPAKAWQVWNEPNFPKSWIPKPSPKGYADLLRISARAIRKVNPHLKVVLAGLGPGLSGGGKYPSWVFLKQLYKLGASPNFDVAAVQGYYTDAAGAEGQIEDFAHVMRAHHDRKTPLWVTETGWSSSVAPGHRWAAGSEAKQADLMRQLFHWVVRNSKPLHIAALFWFDWRDILNNAPGSPTLNFGLRHNDGSVKPDWHVFKRFAKR